MTADPTSSPTGASTTSQPPLGPIAVALGPVQQAMLYLLLVAMLRRLGILPPPDDDTQDVRLFLSAGTTDAALQSVRTKIAAANPAGLPAYDRLVLQLQTTGCTVFA